MIRSSHGRKTDFVGTTDKFYGIANFNKNDKVVSELVHNGFDQEQLGELMLRNKESKEFLTVTVFQIEFIRSE